MTSPLISSPILSLSVAGRAATKLASGSTFKAPFFCLNSGSLKISILPSTRLGEGTNQPFLLRWYKQLCLKQQDFLAVGGKTSNYL
jgi:hypothetical protein